VVDRLIERFNLREKSILEIGCGGGYFLTRLCELGGNTGIGIDPTVPRVGTEQAGRGRVQFIRDFYSNRYDKLSCDFLCCQSVLEDIPNPLVFLTNIRQNAGQNAIASYFEVFNAGRAFDQQETWSIHYEQCNYFNVETLRSLLQRCGFQVLDAGICPGNEQYIFAEAKSSNGTATPLAPCTVQTEQLPLKLSKFAARHVSNVNKWRSKLAEARTQGRKVVLWGSGGKGVSFLNAVGKESGIHYAVDINPSRHGQFIPGSAQRIVPPAFLTECRPDVVILSNPAYDMEIRNQIASIGLDPELWHA
jgi:SAM-dependent methyltransferase